jgi:peptidyl-prolyl cis-trans isomerase A (cyclophilin A)
MKLAVYKHVAAAVLLALAGLGVTAHATTVQFQTSMGDFEVNLFDKTTPETVANFLKYVTEGDYDDTVIHRSIPDFVVQGGGYVFDYEEQEGSPIATYPSVVNEPKLSNKRGTIAMAKKGGQPDSATSQWFFNMSDNSANLDNSNGGFTVFGQVTGNGMEILDAISELRHVGEVPVANYSSQDVIDKTPYTEDHLITIFSVVVLDASPDTADGLNPDATTRKPAAKAKKKSGGGYGLEFIVLLAGLALLRRRQ